MAKYLIFSIALSAVFIPYLTFGAATCPDTTNFELKDGVCIPLNTGLSQKTVKEVVEAVLTWLLGIFAALGIITFVIAGSMYLLAAGDAEQEKKAKNAMKMGIIGIIVGLMGYVVIQAVDAVLNAKTTF